MPVPVPPPQPCAGLRLCRCHGPALLAAPMHRRYRAGPGTWALGHSSSGSVAPRHAGRCRARRDRPPS
eukprot:12442452-Alexandrium_andersonii.AAC.1